MPQEHCEKCMKPVGNEAVDFFSNIFGTESWPERWNCGHWTDFHGWLYIISDISIWAAYFTIPFVLVNFIIRKKDVPFPKIFWLFGAFILACGTSHLVDALMFWWPAYRVNALIRLITALTSWATIFALYKVLPDAFSLKTPRELEKVVEQRTWELHQRINEIRFLADAMPQKVWTAKPDGDIEYFNVQWSAYTGLSTTETVHNAWAKVIHPDDIGETIKRWNHCLDSGSDFEIQHRIMGKNMEYCWHLTRAKAQRDTDANILLWVGTSTDIEEQKKLEHKKDEFIGIASHELKTPLTSIKAYVQLLKRTEDPALSKIYIEKANTYIDKLQGLISELLDVSKIQSGKLELNEEIFDYESLLHDTIEGMQYIQRSHKIIKKGDEAPKFVKADKGRIEQVIINLIDNAVKYSPDSDKIIITTAISGGHVITSIQDFGIGIPNDQRDKIFDRFFRVNNLKPTFAGLGIGLYICSEIVRRHEGKIWVESEVNNGSTFNFTLPLQNI